jgi:hypothetical protein
MAATATVEELAQMAASYRDQSGWLTRAVDSCNLVITEAAVREPNRPLMVQLDRCLAQLWDQEKKCAQICEDIRDGQAQNEANITNIEASLNRDSNCVNAAGIAVMHQLARYDIGLRPAPVSAGGAPAGPARIVCQAEKYLKPAELAANMTPVEFAYWVDAFEVYHAASHMEVANVAVQQAFFKACVHPVIYGRSKSNIVSGVTPVLGQGATVMELMRDKFLLEHPLFSRRLDFFRFKQGRGQSMSYAMTELQRLGDQSTLGALNPIDLYVMRYLTMTDDPELLETLLEVEVPTQQLLKDVVRRFETAARTKKTLSAPAMTAFTEQGAGANAVGRGRDRGCGTDTRAKVREPWVLPNLPYRGLALS